MDLRAPLAAQILPFARRPLRGASTPCLTRPAPVGARSLSTSARSIVGATAARSRRTALLRRRMRLAEAETSGCFSDAGAPNQMLQQTGEDARS